MLGGTAGAHSLFMRRGVRSCTSGSSSDTDHHHVCGGSSLAAAEERERERETFYDTGGHDVAYGAHGTAAGASARNERDMHRGTYARGGMTDQSTMELHRVRLTAI